MTMPPYNNESPASKILAYLRRNGEGSVKEFEKLLEISTTAVREHLTSLQAKDLLATKLVRRGPGRPHLAYFLTPKAQDLFPKEYDTLINLLLQEISSQEGDDRLQVILNAVGARLADEYGGQVVGLELAERLTHLRDVFEARGIPAEVQTDGQGLQICACPYREVAQEHAGVCAMERRMIEQILGEPIALEGTIREGQRSCHFTLVNKS
jgi:predicted ArsR family transcriptional regulator